MNESRYLALMRGVASEAIADGRETRRLVGENEGGGGGVETRVKWFGALARDQAWRLNTGGGCSHQPLIHNFNPSESDVRIFYSL